MVKVDPASAAHRALLGTSYVRAGRYAEAIPHLEQALRLDPRAAQAENYLGGALLALGRAHDALPHFRRASALAPRDAHLHFNLARVLESAGDAEAAAREYERALDVESRPRRSASAARRPVVLAPSPARRARALDAGRRARARIGDGAQRSRRRPRAGRPAGRGAGACPPRAGDRSRLPTGARESRAPRTPETALTPPRGAGQKDAALAKRSPPVFPGAFGRSFASYRNRTVTAAGRFARGVKVKQPNSVSRHDRRRSGGAFSPARGGALAAPDRRA